MWFLITSFDAFLHHMPTLDDCADKSSMAPKLQSTASMRVKTQFGTDYFELSIHIGSIELLAVAGFQGDATTCNYNPFLGSSISSLPPELKENRISNTIHVRIQPAPFSTSNRHLRQYCKASANFPWSFHSLRYVTRGFYPVNPLAFANHLSSVTSNGGTIHMMASFFLSCAAKGRVTSAEVQNMFKLAARDRSISKHLSQSSTFASAATSLPTQHKAKMSYVVIVIQSLAFLESIAEQSDSTKNLYTKLPETKDKVIQILNNGYAHRLKSANKMVIQKASAAHNYTIP